MEKLEFRIGDPILQSLTATDPRMAWLAERVGDYELPLRTDYFPSLVRSIIGQQLAVGAARTIWLRTRDLCGEVTPESITGLENDVLQGAGLSRTKVSYIKDLAGKVLMGEVDLAGLPALSDQQIIAELVRVKGIGLWTAEMFLIFSLGRLDVLSLQDLGLQRAIQWLYGYQKIPAEGRIRTHGRKWAPYRTVASLYLWEVINQGMSRSK